MFITDIWNDFFRFPAWMASLRLSSGGAPPSGSSGGSGGGSGGGGRDFEKIFREYYEPVLRFFLRQGVSREQAKDLTQETFLRVYQNIEEFRGDSSLKTWIFSIAKNVWLNYLRWRHTEKREGEEVSLDNEELKIKPEVLEKILLDEKKKKLYEAVMRLPRRMRACVWYRIYRGLKYREIAERMGISIGTVKAQLFEAEKRLRAELGDYFDSFELRDDGE